MPSLIPSSGALFGQTHLTLGQIDFFDLWISIVYQADLWNIMVNFYGVAQYGLIIMN